MAREVRQKHWSLDEFPVNPRIIARKLRAKVVFSPLDGLSGFIDKRNWRRPEIGINSDEPQHRRRFTLAHELGHLVDRDDFDDSEYSFRDPLQAESEAFDLNEFFANEFAGELLMPAEKVEELRESGWSVPKMAKFFGVSHPALRERLRRLDKHPP